MFCTYLLLDQQTLEATNDEDPHPSHHCVLRGANDGVSIASAVTSAGPVFLHGYTAHKDPHAVFFDEAHHLDAPMYMYSMVWFRKRYLLYRTRRRAGATVCVSFGCDVVRWNVEGALV